MFNLYFFVMAIHEVEMRLTNGAVIYCTAKAAKYLMIGFGLEPVAPAMVSDANPALAPVSDVVELLPDGDIRKVGEK